MAIKTIDPVWRRGWLADALVRFSDLPVGARFSDQHGRTGVIVGTQDEFIAVDFDDGTRYLANRGAQAVRLEES